MPQYFIKHPQEGARSKVHVTAAHSPKEGSQLTKLAELGHFLCAASTTTTTTSTTTSKHFRILDMCSLTCGRRISAMRIASHVRFFLRHKARRRLWRWQGELEIFECDAEILRPQQKQIRFPQKNSMGLVYHCVCCLCEAHFSPRRKSSVSPEKQRLGLTLETRDSHFWWRCAFPTIMLLSATHCLAAAAIVAAACASQDPNPWRFPYSKNPYVVASSQRDGLPDFTLFDKETDFSPSTIACKCALLAALAASCHRCLPPLLG